MKPTRQQVPSERGKDLDPLPFDFYEPSASEVAPSLLGHLLMRRTPQGSCGGIIVETEAYLADDPACHGYRRETPRNRSMYGPPGRAYVYFIYGNHHCFNAVCRAAGIAEAVLVRAIEPCRGEDWIRKQRPVSSRVDLTNGPGKCCEAMGIDRDLDGADLCDAQSPIWIARNPDWALVRSQQGPIRATTRVGITRAAHWPLRFYLPGSHFVSRRAKEDPRPANR